LIPILLFLFSCIWTSGLQETAQPELWIGRWHFEEIWPHIGGDFYDGIMYEMNIYKMGDKLVADLDIDSYMTLRRIAGEVIVTGNGIEIIFVAVREGDSHAQSFARGDILFALTREKDKINTRWEKLKPNRKENLKSSVYFERREQAESTSPTTPLCVRLARIIRLI